MFYNVGIDFPNMVKIRSILIPTDGSDNALVAAEYGLELAQSTNSCVHTLHVFDPNLITTMDNMDTDAYIKETSEKYTDEVIEMGKKLGIDVQPHITSGDPADGIIELSQNYDLVVMGTSGRTGLSHAILGSVAEKVVRLSKSPVLVVKKR